MSSSRLAAALASARGGRFVAVPRGDWIPDEVAPGCQVCGVEFTWWRRRHHCRACGRVTCGACAPLNAADMHDGKKERVCSDCRGHMEALQRGEKRKKGTRAGMMTFKVRTLVRHVRAGGHITRSFQMGRDAHLREPWEHPEEDVKCPKDMELNDWLAQNVVEFYNNATQLIGQVSLVCGSGTCPRMTAGTKFEYLWLEKSGKTVALPAMDYMQRLLYRMEEVFDDSSVFPRTEDEGFSPDFSRIVGDLLRRLFRVLAHLYHHHFPHFRATDTDFQLNTTFREFVVFVRYYNLVSMDDMLPLKELMDAMKIV